MIDTAPPPTFEPDAEDLRRLLPDVGEATRNALHDLHTRPGLETANAALTQLMGARQAVLRYREALQREGRPDVG